MSNRNNNRNRWDDRNDNSDDQERNRNWDRGSKQNTSMHQGNWNAGGGSQQENYGLGDVSQGSANYGHVDDNRGSRYYGTGNYGGYFGSGSDEHEHDTSHHQDRRGFEGRSKDYGSSQSSRGGSYRNSGSHSSGPENYERGPRYGNSNVQGRSHEAGRESGIGGGSRPGYSGSGHSGDSYGSGRSNDWNSGYGDRNRGNDSGRRQGGEEDRDWWDRTADEVSSWFGDDEAARRRELDKRYGPHHGKGPKGFTRSDEKIKDDVEEKLYHDSFVDASDIEVSISGGEVTLTGTVDNKQTKRRAEDIAERVTGVNDVSNHLKVNRTSGAGYSSTIGSLNTATSGTQSDSDKKLDQSKDLNRTGNK